MPSFELMLLWTLLSSTILSLPLIVQLFSRLGVFRKPKPFPFFDLPRELRDMVYDNLIDCNPNYSSRVEPSKSGLYVPYFSPKRRISRLYSILVANRQIHYEFMESISKRARFTLHIDRNNYDKSRLWNIGRDTLKNIRGCDIMLTTTSSMLGTTDPRHMVKAWPVKDRVFIELKKMDNLEDLTLNIRAIGDPLWNPLWVWYHASQTFKDSHQQQKFRSISFSLDSPSWGENHLVQNRDDSWVWHCKLGHYVGNDSGPWQPIREFCAALYTDCQQCQPKESNSE